VNAVNLAERYLHAWNQADPDERAAAVGATWAENATYVDPVAAAEGREQIFDLIGAVQMQVPGHVFRLLRDTVDSHHNVVRFGWELVPAAGGESLAVGFDIAVVEEDGRIGTVLGFLDKAPAAAAAAA
jgi:hypothetical protein